MGVAAVFKPHQSSLKLNSGRVFKAFSSRDVMKATVSFFWVREKKKLNLKAIFVKGLSSDSVTKESWEINRMLGVEERTDLRRASLISEIYSETHTSAFAGRRPKKTALVKFGKLGNSLNSLKVTNMVIIPPS